jgi:hypothetical protein
MVGTVGNKCRWSLCQFAVNNGDYEATDFTAGDLGSSNPSEWGTALVNTQSFDVWDINP